MLSIIMRYFLIILTLSVMAKAKKISFNEDIRPLFSNSCFFCHGPDEETREGGYRLDTFEGATAIKDGSQGIVPGDPEASEVIKRLITHDKELKMPPVKLNKAFTEEQIETVRQWIKEGADYEKHWSYVPPVRPKLPEVVTAPAHWRSNPIDAFIFNTLQEKKLETSVEADKASLARRVALDLTGVPPTLEETNFFINDSSADAYEKFVDRQLAKPTYGEHWTRMWLDLARYADSAGYADDVPRTIWAYRDYVIRAFNENKPYDQFSTEQLAGDLLENSTESQRVATAFHRNTQTNNEGGTNDEEFRNVAVSDRVNTTMATWLGTTIACAQCHTHKYDPITHEEYFQVFDIFNQTQDSDKRNEFPTLALFTGSNLERKEKITSEIHRASQFIKNHKIEPQEFESWVSQLQTKETVWHPFSPSELSTIEGASLNKLADHSILATSNTGESEFYTLSGIVDPALVPSITAIKVEMLTDPTLPNNGPGRAGNGNFVLNNIHLSSSGKLEPRKKARYVRIDLPGKSKALTLAEVQVFIDGENIAPKGYARQSSTAHGGEAKRAIDNNVNGLYSKNSVTHTSGKDDNTFWELDLKQDSPIDQIVLWNRLDTGTDRLKNYRISLLDAERKTVFQKSYQKVPRPNFAINLYNTTIAGFDSQGASSSFNQHEFHVSEAVDPDKTSHSGWATAGNNNNSYAIFPLIKPLPPGQVRVALKQSYHRHTLGKFRISFTTDPQPQPALTAQLLTATRTPAAQRSPQQNNQLRQFFKEHHPKLTTERRKLTVKNKELQQIKPDTTVPVMAEVDQSKRRETHIHLRGSYLSHGPKVHAGFPKDLSPKGFTPSSNTPTRLDLANWIFHPNNPLTARVAVNNFWEKIFGIGIVATSEEFGSQGEPPSHPLLLDWLAIEFRDSGWDIKKLLKLIVTSSAYKQSSHVTGELHSLDPLNRLLARGPRFRLSAEMVRDQALFLSGLLSEKMFGKPVNPPQPDLGLNAAFGGKIDWKTSSGDDKFRRGLYTTWRRSNPYPSMATFDAPNREVCVVRRGRTNTPLQALVTLNDPVFVEAAQAFARKTTKVAKSVDEQITHALNAALSRKPSDSEVRRLTELYQEALKEYQAKPKEAKDIATNPIGPAPAGSDIPHLAALTVVCNVILNLDEMLMKR